MSPLPAGSEPFLLKVISPQGVFLEHEIVSLILPGKNGRLGILSYHAPLVGILKAGEVQFRKTADAGFLALGITGGFFDVRENTVVVTADRVLSSVHDTVVEG